jgi:hypothetical protein
MLFVLGYQVWTEITGENHLFLECMDTCNIQSYIS